MSQVLVEVQLPNCFSVEMLPVASQELAAASIDDLGEGATIRLWILAKQEEGERVDEEKGLIVERVGLKFSVGIMMPECCLRSSLS